MINESLNGIADPPPAHTGVNPGESLLLGYALIGNDPQTPFAILDGLTGGDWNIGVHLISTAGGESEKLIITYLEDGPGTQAPVPEPATILLLGIGTFFMAARRHQFNI